jgi:ribosomal protein S5
VNTGGAAHLVDEVLDTEYRAIRNMQPIPRYENRTIYGDVKGKVGATELQLRGIGHGVRSLLLLAKRNIPGRMELDIPGGRCISCNAKIQSQYRAIRNMQPIPRYENRTIYGDVKGKVGADTQQTISVTGNGKTVCTADLS